MDIGEAYKKGLLEFEPENKRQRLLLYSFRYDDKGNTNYKAINAAIFDVFKSLARSKNKKARETIFTIYAGDYNGFYWIGLRANIMLKISELFRKKFSEMLGGVNFEMEFGEIPHIPLIETFKYNAGEVIEYDGEEMLGQTRVDTNTGLSVIYKQMLPNMSFFQELADKLIKKSKN